MLVSNFQCSNMTPNHISSGAPSSTAFEFFKSLSIKIKQINARNEKNTIKKIVKQYVNSVHYHLNNLNILKFEIPGYYFLHDENKAV